MSQRPENSVTDSIKEENHPVTEQISISAEVSENSKDYLVLHLSNLNKYCNRKWQRFERCHFLLQLIHT